MEDQTEAPEFPTNEEVASFIESKWKRAHDVVVESVRVDTAGKLNAWTVWLVDHVDGQGNITHADEMAQNVTLKQHDDGRLELV